MCPIVIARAVITHTKGYEIQNIVGTYLGQKHQHKTIVDIAKWAARAPGWRLTADRATLFAIETWLDDNPEGKHWQDVYDLRKRIT